MIYFVFIVYQNTPVCKNDIKQFLEKLYYKQICSNIDIKRKGAVEYSMFTKVETTKWGTLLYFEVPASFEVQVSCCFYNQTNALNTKVATMQIYVMSLSYRRLANIISTMGTAFKMLDNWVAFIQVST